MVGVIVREDDALDCLARRKDKFPQSAGLAVGDAAVDDRRTAAVLEQPEVDMVQLKRQRHRQPTHARRDFHRRAGRRNIWKGIPKTGHCRGAIYPITSAFPTEGGGKSMQRNALALAVASACLMFGALDARAAGFALHEQGISGLGNAYAGAVAVAEDATTVWWNPAGMSRLAPGKHFALGGAYIVPKTEFENRGSVPAALSNPALTGSGGDAGEAKLVPSLFFAMDLGPTRTLRPGVSVPFC